MLLIEVFELGNQDTAHFVELPACFISAVRSQRCTTPRLVQAAHRSLLRMPISVVQALAKVVTDLKQRSEEDADIDDN